MVVIWGNILSFIGNVFALAVEVLVFNAFFPRNENRKSQWLCILLWWAIATFLSISVGTKFGYTLTMLQEVALIYLFCAFLYQSRWDRRLFIVVTVYSLLFSYSHWFDELCMRISGFTYEEYIWNVPLYSIFYYIRSSGRSDGSCNIMYADYSSGKVLYLCSQANCAHNNSSICSYSKKRLLEWCLGLYPYQ